MTEHEERLIKAFRYDPETGLLYNNYTRSNRSPKGQEAGWVAVDGARQVMFERHFYKAHRLIWFMYHKEWPKSVIDHIDGNALNNRIDNLRSVTQRANVTNLKKHREGKLAGCSKIPCGKWKAHIEVKGRKIHLGHFNTEQEAHEAYLVAFNKLEQTCL